MELTEIIENSIKELQKEYQNNKRKYLTEGDIVSTLFSKLDKMLVKTSMSIHSQLRPYIGSPEDAYVIQNDSWIKQDKANRGALVDLAIIDRNEVFWNESFEKAKKDQNSKQLKYWRILSYPVKAFRAVIEVKIKVKRNKKRIFIK